MYDDDDDDDDKYIHISYGMFSLEHINNQNITQLTASDHQFSVVKSTAILPV
jgi:hypothetical protein